MRFLFVLFLLSQSLFSQELNCRININYSAIPSPNKEMFNSMRQSIYEFVNNTNWTNDLFENEERIECTILIRVDQQLSTDEFSGSISVQSSRPIFKTLYNSPLLNIFDDQFRFKYVEFETLEFNENTHLSNLTSVLAFYVNIILGLDFASFSDQGGIEYFVKAQNIVNNCQNAPEIGWKAFENDKNRYWIAHDFLDSRYVGIHDVLYKYHRRGMDKLSEEPEDARFEITEAIEDLRKIYRENPNSFILKLFFDSKSEEISKIYSEAYPNEKARVVQTLVEIDPVNSSRYQSIMNESSEGR